MTAKDKYERWLNAVSESDLREELVAIRGNDDEIEARFSTELAFGTAGLRGIMGAGSARMNVCTVRRATQGLAEYIKDIGGQSRGVAIAYDSRNRSAEFSREAAKVLCANGIRVYLFDGLRPTPELSFAIRFLGCVSGINITASHNPAKYNGYKAYAGDGGQLSLEASDAVTAKIKMVDIFDGVKTLSEKEAVDSGLLRYIGGELDKAYYEKVLGQAVNRDAIEKAGDFKVVYTPFHGAGNAAVQSVLKLSGMKNLLVVREQEMPDGDFPTVKSPNPEDKEGFALAIELAKKNDVDLIIGTDPDGDRLGVVARDRGGNYVNLTGNQVGVLLAEYILSQRAEKGLLPESPFIVKTVVTTEMVRAIAARHEVEVEEVLTGFKFIAECIKKHEDSGSGKKFVYGFEESNGYLSGDYCRDKDAVVASLLTVEMAAFYKRKNMSLYDALHALYKSYKTYAEGVENVYAYGLDGPEKIAKIIGELRENPPETVGGLKVRAIRDYQSGVIRRMDGTTGKTMQPLNNMLYFELEEDGWFAIRPSGTEPKFKVYFGYANQDPAIAWATLDRIMADVRKAVGD